MDFQDQKTKKKGSHIRSIKMDTKFKCDDSDFNFKPSEVFLIILFLART